MHVRNILLEPSKKVGGLFPVWAGPKGSVMERFQEKLEMRLPDLIAFGQSSQIFGRKNQLSKSGNINV